MAGEGENSIVHWNLPAVYPYIDPDGQLIELPYCPSTNTFGTLTNDPFNPITETAVEAIGSSDAEVSTSNVESQDKRKDTESFDNLRAKELIDNKGKQKRDRAVKWSDEEKVALLMMKLEALEKSEKGWFRFVSEQLSKRYEIERDGTSCQQQWDSLLKAYKAIGNLHDLKSQSEEHPVLFWDMDESARMAMKRRGNEDLKNLPGAFPKEWYDLMEKIIFFQAPVRKSQDIEADHRGESNREPSTSTRANVRPGALDSLTIPSNQALVSSDALHPDCITQQSNDKILPDEEVMPRIVLLVDEQIEQALMPKLSRRQEDNEQKHRENLRAREEEHQRRLKAMDAEHSLRLLAIEAEHSRRLQAIETEHSRRLQVMEAEHSRRLQAREAELL